jgi:hypothetical protein
MASEYRTGEYALLDLWLTKLCIREEPFPERQVIYMLYRGIAIL